MTAPEPFDRTAAFTAAVSERKLKTGAATSDKVTRGLGVALMLAGLVGTFLAYNNSRSMDDGRDIATNQILALVFLAVTVVGTGLYVVGAVAAVLRLWLLRQLVESQDRMDQLTESLREK